MVLKNKKLLLSTILIIGVVFLSIGKIYFSSNEKTLDKNNNVKNQSNELDHLEKVNNISEEKNLVLTEKKNIGAMSEIDKIKSMFPDSAFLTIVSLENAPLSTEKKLDLAKKIQNLYKYGSLSGGKLTHEFSNLDKYRSFLEKYGYETIKEKISFPPQDIPLNNNSLHLTGSYYSGGYTENAGFDSLYRLYEAPNGEKIEVNQTKLDKNGMKLLVIEETLNYRLNEIPATLETFDSDSVYNIRFTYDGYRYAISTQNLDKNHILNIANSIIKQ